MITILYIGVHYLKNDLLWRSETWIDRAFNYNNVTTIKVDYRKIINECSIDIFKKEIEDQSKKCDLIFLQRGDKLNPEIFNAISLPIIFWSTEPIQLKNDVDILLNSDISSA